MVGKGKAGLARICFVYHDKLVNVTHQHLHVMDYNNLLSGQSFSIGISKKYDGAGIYVVACTEVKHTNAEWGN